MCLCIGDKEELVLRYLSGLFGLIFFQLSVNFVVFNIFFEHGNRKLLDTYSSCFSSTTSSSSLNHMKHVSMRSQKHINSNTYVRVWKKTERVDVVTAHLT